MKPFDVKAGLVTLVAFGLLTGCASVTISPSDERKLVSMPDYEEVQPFYFWGLAPEQREVDVTGICGGEARQMQAQTTFVDGLLGAITLGIYAPRTVRIWCEDN